MFRTLLITCSLGLLVFDFTARAATNAWYASSGLFPEQTTTNWTLSDSAPGADPSLSGGYMTLDTAANVESMFYRQTGNLAIPSNWTIEFRARFDSRNGTANNNSSMAVFFTAAPSSGNILYLRQDDIWLATGFLGRGPSATVDTDSAFHTYRIVLGGTAVGSAVNVFYDANPAPVLTYQLVGDPTLTGSAPRIGFGDATGGDSGVSEWEYFWHNGSAVAVVPEPSASALVVAGAAWVFTLRRWERRGLRRSKVSR
ncbi:MAG: PEP-CTERM sorting domain-containing protein [Verrucomicrobia bacterium]|jgi:hypothetical protein|nr:PEP-CTERM sorting domain-containing protein [Verrucomicrobiota bacterium]